MFRSRSREWQDVSVLFSVEVGMDDDMQIVDITYERSIPASVCEELQRLFAASFSHQDLGVELAFDVRSSGGYDEGDYNTPSCRWDNREVKSVDVFPLLPNGGYGKLGKPLSAASVQLLAELYANEIDDADLPSED